jgi:hypothetical protein
MKDEIIYTDDYALIVSDEHIKDVRPFMGQYHLEGGLTINKFPNYLTDLGACKLIIAHRPLTNAPILEGVALLPEFEDDDFLNTEIQIVGDNKTMSVSNFLKKYGKETYKYTEDDLVAVWNIAFNEGMSLDDEINEPVSFKDVIKSLQQPKRPKYFEMEVYSYDNPEYNTYPKTKLISQCQTELVGKYIF